MKKNLLVILISVSLFLGGRNANAQLANGCIAPDFTALDINGTSWHLYDLLNQGKTVFMDISATWCGPCWSYHNSGALEDLYNYYGPTGSIAPNELMVLFIEGDGSTNTNCLYGSSGCNSTTQGDWVTGTPYPIIDNAAIASSYQIGYYPTIYMITPDRICRENSQITTAQHYAAKNQYSILAIPGNDGGIDWGCGMNNNVTGCSAGVNLSVRLFNYSTSALTSATIQVSVNSVVQQTIPWTGNLATYAYATVSLPGITGNVGANTAQITITGINGGSDTRASNNSTSIPFSIFSAIGGPPVAQSFPSSTFPPAGWILANGGSPYTWSFSTAGYNGAGSAKMEFYLATAGDVDVLTLPPMDFTGYSSGTLTFDRSHKQFDANSIDNLKIKVSTNCGATWTTPYTKSSSQILATGLTSVLGYSGLVAWTPTTSTDWASDNLNLNAYLGNSSVLVKFEANSGYGNNLYLDNINFNFTTGISSVTIPVHFNLYPNPATNFTSVSLQLNSTSDVTINVVNALGQVVQSIVNTNLAASEYTFDINTQYLSPGIYNVNIISAEGVTSRKLIKE